jgi:hypothetical protein
VPAICCTEPAGNLFLVESMKFISLDSSGEMEPLEMLFPPVTVPGNTASPDIPVIGLDSESPLPDLDEVPLSDPAAGGLPLQLPQEDASEEPAAVLRKGDFWLEGEIIMCACPDCSAPMSIRLWLMIADCWRCNASVLISEEQEREIRQLLDRAGTAVPQQQRHRRSAAPAPVPSYPSRKPSMAQQRVREKLRDAGTDIWITRIFRDMPSWIVSLLFHIILLTLLGLLEVPRDDESRTIVLSLVVGPDHREGGSMIKTDPKNEIAPDLPIPKNVNMDDPEQQAQVMHDQETARELIQDFDTFNPRRPDLDEVKRRIREAHGTRTTILARDPRVRVEMVTHEGGTTRTEAAVARGLRWLSMHQESDGSWSIKNFGHADDCNCGNPGSVISDSAATSLALLPFLGAGQTHEMGKYKEVVGRGLDWLLANQLPNGDLSQGSTGNTRMYAHGQGAIVLCEAFMLSGDEKLRRPAQKAVDFIVKAQHDGGGWRYRPGDAGDTSVLGWQVMALQSARMANFYVPPHTIQKAQSYLDQVQWRNGAWYGYMPGQKPNFSMTAEGLLCRMYLGWTLEYPGLVEGGEWLLENHPPSRKPRNMYYLYYATQAIHHLGGETWSRWNTEMRNVLVESQETRGHMLGSWVPVDQHDRAGGRLYATSLAVCCLEVYYRQLPLFKRVNLK